MSDAAVNDIPVMRARLSECRRGNWELEALLSTAGEVDVPTGEITFRLLDMTWSGTVMRAGQPYQQARIWATGGRGRLFTVAPPRAYRSTSFLQIAQELLDDVGEELDYTGSVGLDQMLLGWSRWEREAIYELESLVGLRRDLDGAVWRILRSGQLRIAPSVITDCEQSMILLGSWPQRAQRLYAMEDEADGVLIEPGQRLEEGVVIDRIDWKIEPDQLRITTWTVPEALT